MEQKFSIKDIQGLINLHEFNLIFLPGVVFAAGLLLLYPNLHLSFLFKDNGLEILIIFLLISYALGYVVEVIGNRIEWLIEKKRFEINVLGKKKYILGNQKNKELLLELTSPTKSSDLLKYLYKNHIVNSDDIRKISQKEWNSAIRTMKSEIDHKDPINKSWTFNNQSKLCRGLAASILLILLFTLIKYFSNHLCITLIDTWTLIFSLFLSVFGLFWYMRNWERRELQKIYESYPTIN